MTIWLIVEAPNTLVLEDRIIALRTAYTGKDVRGRDNPNRGEAIGKGQYNKAKTKIFVGTSRASVGNISDLVNGRPWLTVTRDASFLHTAEWEEREEPNNGT